MGWIEPKPLASSSAGTSDVDTSGEKWRDVKRNIYFILQTVDIGHSQSPEPVSQKLHGSSKTNATKTSGGGPIDPKITKKRSASEPALRCSFRIVLLQRVARRTQRRIRASADGSNPSTIVDDATTARANNPPYYVVAEAYMEERILKDWGYIKKNILGKVLFILFVQFFGQQTPHTQIELIQIKYELG